MVVMNRFGGPSYFGTPAVDVTAAFIKAGGGAGSFSMVRAFSSMIGDTVLQSELGKLRARFGDRDTDRFVHIFDFAVSDAWKRAGENNLVLPAPGALEGHDLAQAIVTTGTTDSRYFFTGFLLDKLLTHKVHQQVLSDIDVKYGANDNETFNTIANAFFVDLAHQIGDVAVILPSPLPHH